MIVVEWHTTHDGTSPLRVFGSVTTGLLFVACGLVARRRTPYPRMGWVLIIAAACWMVEDLAIIAAPWANNVSQVTSSASAMGFALAAFTFPTGRLKGSIDRWLMVAVGVYTFVIGPLIVATNECRVDCDPSFLHIWVSGSTNRSLDRALASFGLVVLGVAACRFVYRWIVATRPERRMVAPFLVACFVIAIVNLPKVLSPDDNPVGDLLPLSFGLGPLAVLLGLARVRLVRVGVTSIVRELDSAATLPQLGAVLRRSLGDKTIAIWKWDVESFTWLDEMGEPAGELARARHAWSTPIDSRGGQPLGLLFHDPALAHDPELMQAVAGAIRLSLENASLHDEVTVQLARAADAADGERRRVARDLHDGAQQRLVTLMYDVSALESMLGDTAAPDVQRRLSVIQDGARGALSDLRRLVHGLAPATLADEGLGNAIRELVLGVPVVVEVVDRLTERLPPPVESAAFLIAAESLANVSKHAVAQRVRILIECTDGALHMAISDDGRGGADPTRGSGLLGLQQRAAALGGRVTVASPVGRGTTVGVQLPVHGAPVLRVVANG